MIPIVVLTLPGNTFIPMVAEKQNILVVINLHNLQLRKGKSNGKDTK